MNLIQRYHQHLSTAREGLLHEIHSLNEQDFNRATVGTWSIGQICHHLWKTEILFTKAIQFGLRRKPVTDAERKPVEVVLDQSVKYRAPEVAEPEAGPFQSEELLRMLGESRQQLLAMLEKVEDPAAFAEVAVNHPRFGDLPLDQWVELLYMHERRHTEQIRELKSYFS